jgi:formamidopyrimidine-DNA glycosylase
VESDEAVATLGPDAFPAPPPDEFATLLDQPRHLHPLLRDQRAIAGIGRAWANEILHTARLSPFKLSTDLTGDEVERLSASIDDELARGLELRERGKKDDAVYRVHDRLGEPCHVCGGPLHRVDYEEHTIYYCPTCQTGGKVLKDRRLSRLLR